MKKIDKIPDNIKPILPIPFSLHSNFCYFDENERIVFLPFVETLQYQPIIVNDVFFPLLKDTNRFLVLKGGGGSGKSDFVALKLLLELQARDHFRAVYCRKYAKDVKDSQHQLFIDLIRRYGWEDRFRVYKQPLKIVYKPNPNNYLIGSGLDNPDRLKSISEINCFWLEEPIGKTAKDDMTVEDLKQMNIRMRTTVADYCQILVSLNPINKNNFIYDNFYANEFFTPLTKHDSTYLNNPFCSQPLIDQYQEMKRYDENDYNVYALGHWGKLRSGAEWIFNFDTQVHVKTLEYNPALPHHYSFDFNIRPYYTLLLFQTSYITIHDYEGIPKEIEQIRLVKEWTLKHPDNSNEKACEIIRSLANDARTIHKTHPPIYIYGDPDGLKGRTGIKSKIVGYEGQDARPFDEIFYYLRGYVGDGGNRVLRGHPNNVLMRDMTNKLLKSRDEFANHSFAIDESCKESIDDFDLIQESVSGKYDKQVKKTDGVAEERRGHCFSAYMYFIRKYLDSYFRESKIEQI